MSCATAWESFARILAYVSLARIALLAARLSGGCCEAGSLRFALAGLRHVLVRRLASRMADGMSRVASELAKDSLLECIQNYFCIIPFSAG